MADQGQGQAPIPAVPGQGQAGQGLGGGIMQQVANNLEGLLTAVNSQTVSQYIKPFEGDPKLFKTWVKSIEKWTLMGRHPAHENINAAFQTAQGGVSDFIQRYMLSNPQHTWDQLKAELTARFGEITDPQHALSLLRHIKQKKDENVQMYSERILDMAMDAFAVQFAQPGGRQAVEPQLVGYFQDGLASDVIKMRVMRTNPPTLQAAVTTAMAEQNLRKRFELRKGDIDDTKPPKPRVRDIPDGPTGEREETPMDIDHIRPSKRCERCLKRGHQARECRARWPSSSINAVGENTNANQGCWVCASPHHFKRECPQRQGAGRKRTPYNGQNQTQQSLN